MEDQIKITLNPVFLITVYEDTSLNLLFVVSIEIGNLEFHYYLVYHSRISLFLLRLGNHPDDSDHKEFQGWQYLCLFIFRSYVFTYY